MNKFDHLPGPAINRAKWPETDLPWGTDEQWGCTWISEYERRNYGTEFDLDDPDPRGLRDYKNGWFDTTTRWPEHWWQAFKDAKQDIYYRQATGQITLAEQDVEIKQLLDRYRCNWA